MYALATETVDDVFFIGRRVLGLLRDPRSDARRLARLIDCMPPLASAVNRRAELLLSGRRRVNSTIHAITLIGYDRLERAVRAYLRSEYARVRAERERAEAEGLPIEDRPRPVMELRYAAL